MRAFGRDVLGCDVTVLDTLKEGPRSRGAGLAARAGLARRDRARRLGLASREDLAGAQDRTWL
jgi:hypothetical protein